MKQCYHSPTRFLEIDNITYYMADRVGSKAFDGDIVLNLTFSPGTRATSNIYSISQLSKHMKPLPLEIMLPWVDFGIPPVEHSFWKAFHSYLKSKKYTSICIHCEQGHGRTGTAASAFCIALKEKKVEDAVSYIRKIYCASAVESNNQVNYLINLDITLNNRENIDNANILKKLKPNDLFSENDFDLSTYISRIIK